MGVKIKANGAKKKRNRWLYIQLLISDLPKKKKRSKEVKFRNQRHMSIKDVPLERSKGRRDVN